MFFKFSVGLKLLKIIKSGNKINPQVNYSFSEPLKPVGCGGIVPVIPVP